MKLGRWGSAGGWHWSIAWHNGWWKLNVPYWPHRILVIARGRVGRDADFHPNWVCCYRLQLRFCCPTQLRRTANSGA